MSLPFNLSFIYSANTARRDLVAGATVAAIAIPQAMAYALIAGVDPRFGLYSAIVVTLVASIFGSSSHLINGPTNAISLVVFSALTGFDARFDAYQAMFLLGIMVGITQILISVFKLGDLTRYISESVILGFMAGAGLLVGIGQVGNFLGVSKTGGGHSVLVNLWETITHSGPYNLVAIAIGLGTLLATLVLRQLVNRYKLPQMDMLAALIIASTVAACFGWSTPRSDGKTIISVVGTVPAALPSFHIPEVNFDWVMHLLASTMAISFLGLLEALAVAKSIADPKKGILKQLIRNPADVFYYAGAGNDDGCLALQQNGWTTKKPECWLSPDELQDLWKPPFDLKVLILAGCPVLTVPRLRSPLGTMPTSGGPWSALLKPDGPLAAILGYKDQAPLDNPTGKEIATRMGSAIPDGGLGDKDWVPTWLEINAEYRDGHNTRNAVGMDAAGYTEIVEPKSSMYSTKDYTFATRPLRIPK